jgi:phage-related protein
VAGNPQILVKFLADTSGLSKGMSEAGASTKSFGSSVKSFGKTAAVAAGAAGLAGLTIALKTGIDEFTEASKVSAQTDAVLKSTGKSAGVTAKQVDELAGSLMKKSGVDDEAIQSGENMLLTFTRVQNQAGKGNDIFNRATKTMLDMSVALGQDLPSSAMQLGKALNDPIRGMTALQRVGVTFSDAQREQIKTMVEAGDTMGAQKLILAELNKEFGGSAEAVGKTLPGQVNILKQSFSNLAGELVGTLAPALQTIASAMAAHPALFKALVIGVLALAAALVVMNVALAVTSVVASPIALIILAVVAAVAALAAVAYLVYKNWGAISAFFGQVWDAIKTGAEAVFNWLKSNWPLLLGVLTGPFGLAIALIVTHWNEIKNAAITAMNAIKAVVTTVWNAIVAAVRAALSAIQAAVTAGWNAIRGVVTSVSSAINSAVTAAWNGIRATVTAVGTALQAAVTASWNVIRAVISAASNAARAAVAGLTAAFNTAKGAVSALAGVLHGLDGALDAVKGAAAAVAGVLRGVLTSAANIAKGALGPLSGIASAIAGAFNAAAGAANALASAIRSIPSHIKLPSMPGGGLLGKLPGFETGGVVPGPRGAPMLAVVHGGETILPASGGGAGAPVHVRVFIGDTELKGLVRTEIVQSNTGLARTLLAGARV